jgi:competence protein ComEA
MNLIKEWIEELQNNFHLSSNDKNKFYILFVLAGIVAGGFFLLSRGIFTAPIPIASAATNSNTQSNAAQLSTSTGAETTTIYIDVSGKVKHPGLYQLAKGARVADALKAAGGALSGVDLTYLNLAQLIDDGDQIIVSASPEIISSGSVDQSTSNSPSVTSSKSKTSKTSKSSKSGGGSSKKKSLPTTPINLNSATATQLEQLPGVGPSMAAKILAYRQSLGRFTNITQLQNVSGMGPAHYAKIKNYVRTS